jgi:hypothetical protein
MSLKDIRYRVNTIFVDMGSLGINFCACSSIGDDQSYAWRRSDRATVLQNNVSTLIGGGRPVVCTLSPNPHIRARFGCCTTSSLRL